MSVGNVATEWVRFVSENPPLTLEAGVQIQAAPGDPSTWTLRCGRYGGCGGGSAAGRGQ